MENTKTLNTEIYGTLEKSYNFFNKSLFGDALPPCVITLYPYKKTNGFYGPQHFASKVTGEIVSEISLNPENFAEREDIEILSTLVHEMCHAYQDLVNNSNPKSGGHDKEWGSLMESIGLVPSHNGEVGGKKTGKKITHYIDDYGKFKESASVFLQENKIEWIGHVIEDTKEKKTRKKNKFKFLCPTCQQEIWGKIDASVLCGKCTEEMKIDENELLLSEDED